MFDPKETTENWLDALIDVWGENLKNCRKSINEVIELGVK
jgi:hypothetical protein